MLNDNELDIKSITTIPQSDNTIKFKVHLKSDPNVFFHYVKKTSLKMVSFLGLYPILLL